MRSWQGWIITSHNSLLDAINPPVPYEVNARKWLHLTVLYAYSYLCIHWIFILMCDLITCVCFSNLKRKYRNVGAILPQRIKWRYIWIWSDIESCHISHMGWSISRWIFQVTYVHCIMITISRSKFHQVIQLIQYRQVGIQSVPMITPIHIRSIPKLCQWLHLITMVNNICAVWARWIKPAWMVLSESHIAN